MVARTGMPDLQLPSSALDRDLSPLALSTKTMPAHDTLDYRVHA